MAENSKIEWCDHTFNPWEGCTKVGPGCDHCYAEARNSRFGGGISPNWGTGMPRRRTTATNWENPLKWERKAKRFGVRYRVFCASLADIFDNEIDYKWRSDLFELIQNTPHLDWLLLTKRIGNAITMFSECGYMKLPSNIWMGATIVNQEEADRDIQKLLKIPVDVHFLSMEPLLSDVDISPFIMPPIHPNNYLPRLDQVIVGGESGPGARPMLALWARSLRDQCRIAGVPFFMKQMGGPVKRSMPIIPPDLMIREFPVINP